MDYLKADVVQKMYNSNMDPSMEIPIHEAVAQRLEFTQRLANWRKSSSIAFPEVISAQLDSWSETHMLQIALASCSAFNITVPHY